VWGLVVRFELRDEAAAADFDALVAATVPKVREREPGTLIYAVHRVSDAPLSRVFYELYASQGSFAEHENNDHTKRFLAERDQYLTGLRVEFLATPTGIGVPVDSS
jgi:quinol monooxygenase YgiN